MQSQGKSAEETHTQRSKSQHKEQTTRGLDLLGEIHLAKLRNQIQIKEPILMGIVVVPRPTKAIKSANSSTNKLHNSLGRPH